MAKCPYCEKPVTLDKNNPDQVKREKVGGLLTKSCIPVRTAKKYWDLLSFDRAAVTEMHV